MADLPGENGMPSWRVIGIIAFVLTTAFGIAGYIGERREKPEKPEEQDREKKTASSDPLALAMQKDPVAPAVPMETVDGCRCITGDGEVVSRSTLTLNAPVAPNPPKPMMLGVERYGKKESFTGTTDLAVPAWLGAHLPPHIALACDDGTFAMIAGTAATGWSSQDGTIRWNATLPASIDASSEHVCTELKVENGTTKLELANGKSATLSLADGHVR